MKRKPVRRTANEKVIAAMASLILFSFGMHCILRGIVLPAVRADFGLSYTEMSGVVSVSSVGYLLMALFSAKLCERIGQKNALSLFSAVLSITACLIAASGTYLHLVVLFLFAGCAYGGIECTVTAITKRYHPLDSDRAVNHVFGFYSAGSFSIALMGGWLLYRGIGWRTAYLLAAAAAALAFFSSLRVVDAAAEAAPQVDLSDAKTLLSDRTFIVMCVSTALLSGASAASINWMNLFLTDTVTDMTIWESSCATAFFFAWLYIGRSVISRLLARFCGVTLAIVCSLITGAVVLLVSLVDTPALMLCGIALFGFFSACLYPLLISITNGLAPGSLIYSVTFTAISVMNFLVSYLMGVVADAYNLPGSFRFCALLYLTAAGAVFLCRKEVLRRAGLGEAGRTNPAAG